MARKSPTLDDLLLRTGESYDAFADRAGVARFTVYRLRAGLIDRPRRKTLHAIAAALDMDVSKVAAAVDSSRKAAKKG